MTDMAMAAHGLRLPDLVGRRVLVTGASSGIGAAVAAGFAAQGSLVAVHYNASADQAQALVERLTGDGARCAAFGGDFTDMAAVAAVVDGAADWLGGLDVLVNNAGTLVERRAVADLDDRLIDRTFDLNARSVVTAINRALPALKDGGAGAIINTSSIAARTGGSAGAAAYAAAKAYVSSLTRTFATELAGDGIRVNAVSPGTIHTRFHDQYSSPDKLEATRRRIPMLRLGTASDCVGAFLFLASPQLSGYVTGQILEVNGGQLMV